MGRLWRTRPLVFAPSPQLPAGTYGTQRTPRISCSLQRVIYDELARSLQLRWH